MTFRELDTVVLDHDLPEHDLRKGDLGAVVRVHSPLLLEIEFVRASGKTQALLQLPPNVVRHVAEEDVPAVRSSTSPRRGAA